MKIGIDIRCLMERERSGVGEYAYQFLDDIFSDIAKRGGSFARTLFGVQDEQELVFFLFWNSWRDVSANIPKWNYSFVHYCGFHWPNKILNFCLKFLKFPKLDKLIEAKALHLNSPPFQGGGKEGVKIDTFIFPNQNFYALSRGVKKIVIVHDLSPELYLECFSPKQRLWHKFVNLRAIVQEADKIIAVSENTKFDLINRYKIVPAKIAVLYPKISSVRYFSVSEYEKRVRSQTSEAFTYSHELENGSKERASGNYILFLGTIEPRKNVLGLLKAYEMLYRHCEEAKLTKQSHDRLGIGRAISRNLSHEIATLRSTSELAMTAELPELWIAGKAGYKSKQVFDYWKKMRDRAERDQKDRAQPRTDPTAVGSGTGVKFLGYVSEEEKWKLYRGARVFVYPSLYEGFGMPILEAQSCGTPVVTSLTSSMHEIVKEKGLLVDPNRTEDLAQALILMLAASHCEERTK